MWNLGKLLKCSVTFFCFNNIVYDIFNDDSHFIRTQRSVFGVSSGDKNVSQLGKSQAYLLNSCTTDRSYL